jgi:hypothetical protein
MGQFCAAYLLCLHVSGALLYFALRELQPFREADYPGARSPGIASLK